MCGGGTEGGRCPDAMAGGGTEGGRGPDSTLAAGGADVSPNILEPNLKTYLKTLLDPTLQQT